MEKNLPPKDVCAAVKRRLIRLAESYQKEVTSEMLGGFIDALGDLTELEVEIGFIAAARRAGEFMPNPGDIRTALALAKEKLPAKLSEHADCELCHGTGFKMVLHPQANEDAAWQLATVATRCNHA